MCTPFWCVFPIIWHSSWNWCTVLSLWLVHPSRVFFACSGVPPSNPILLTLGNLYTPLVRFSYILGLPMKLVYRCFVVIGAPISRVFRVFWSSRPVFKYSWLWGHERSAFSISTNTAISHESHTYTVESLRSFIVKDPVRKEKFIMKRDSLYRGFSHMDQNSFIK